MRAALAADSDAEPDPLSYLRDELQAAQNAPQSRPGGSRELATAGCAGTPAASAAPACSP